MPVERRGGATRDDFRGKGRHLIVHAATEARRLRLPAVRLYTNVMMTENLSLYAHIGFVETQSYRRMLVTEGIRRQRFELAI
jgi:GNAT superfamily N-acetyltransferase